MTYHFWMMDLVTNKKLTKREEDKIWDYVMDVVEDKLATAASRHITKKQFAAMFKELNK